MYFIGIGNMAHVSSVTSLAGIQFRQHRIAHNQDSTQLMTLNILAPQSQACPDFQGNLMTLNLVISSGQEEVS